MYFFVLSITFYIHNQVFNQPCLLRYCQIFYRLNMKIDFKVRLKINFGALSIADAVPHLAL